MEDIWNCKGLLDTFFHYVSHLSVMRKQFPIILKTFWQYANSNQIFLFTFHSEQYFHFPGRIKKGNRAFDAYIHFFRVKTFYQLRVASTFEYEAPECQPLCSKVTQCLKSAAIQAHTTLFYRRQFSQSHDS